MGAEGVILSAGVTILAAGLLVVSLASYRKHRKPRLLFTTLVFLLLLVKGVLYTLYVFLPQLNWVEPVLFSIYAAGFDFFVLLFLFFTIVKR